MLLISGGHEANGCGDIRPLFPNVRVHGPRCKSLTGVFVSAGGLIRVWLQASAASIECSITAV
jgi:hypothetical protein